MADITMCSGRGCPLSDKCFRVSAPKSQRQSYFLGVPYNGWCDYYWPVGSLTPNFSNKDRIQEKLEA